MGQVPMSAFKFLCTQLFILHMEFQQVVGPNLEMERRTGTAYSRSYNSSNPDGMTLIVNSPASDSCVKDGMLGFLTSVAVHEMHSDRRGVL